jgi:hypothetical protein
MCDNGLGATKQLEICACCREAHSAKNGGGLGGSWQKKGPFGPGTEASKRLNQLTPKTIAIVMLTQIKLAPVLPTEPKGHSIRDQVANTLNTIHILFTHTHAIRAHVTAIVGR